jgi:hypothetical protein
MTSAPNPDEAKTAQSNRQLAVVEPNTGLALASEAPAAIAHRAMEVAEQLKSILTRGELTIRIPGPNGAAGREFVRIEGWQAIGSMLGLSTVADWTRPLPENMGWEARVTLLDPHGRALASGEAMVGRDENTWRNRADYALRSMAQTRATGKAYRSAFGWIMSMAGYAATPAEEVDAPEDRSDPPPPRQRPAAQAARPNPTAAARAPRAAAQTPPASSQPPQRPPVEIAEGPGAEPLPQAPRTVKQYIAFAMEKYGYTEAQVFELHNAKGVTELAAKGLSNLMEEAQRYYDQRNHPPEGNAEAPAEAATVGEYDEDGTYREVEVSPPPDDDDPPLAE